jgi:hypothetical protein
MEGVIVAHEQVWLTGREPRKRLEVKVAERLKPKVFQKFNPAHP